MLIGVALGLGWLIGRTEFTFHKRLSPIVFRATSSVAGSVEEKTTRALTTHENVAAVPSAIRSASESSNEPPVPMLKAPLFKAPLWQPSSGEAPWLFSGAVGETARSKEQLQMRKNSGYMPRDSPLPYLGTPNNPVLTGTAFHHGHGNCPARCSLHGVCTPEGMCDCAPYYWGPDCSIPVVTQKICVYNDSQPWFCDKPACVHSKTEVFTHGGISSECVGPVLSRCQMQCSGRGSCRHGRCDCYDGFEGEACSSPTRWAAYGARSCTPLLGALLMLLSTVWGEVMYSIARSAAHVAKYRALYLWAIHIVVAPPQCMVDLGLRK